MNPSIDVQKIKLVIWDLDDTFWSGTLSEGGSTLINKNVELAQKLLDKGIMNSICSKNTFEDVKNELDKYQLWDLFVFPSIDWTAKAPRIQHMIKTMGLRPTNVLFIDDNTMNLNEVSFFLPEIMTLNAKDIDFLINNIDKINKEDKAHNRLNQYRVLEKKNEEREKIGTAEEFLKQSDIRVKVNYNCLSEIDRIEELIGRTNQLNFTKLRSTKEEILSTLNNPNFSCGTISVKDKYGDYGIVGFFALNKQTNTLLHFLFSCRTIGMGIEQYVYELLDYPTLNVVGEVINQVENKKIVNWIKSDTETNTTSQDKKNMTNQTKQVSVLFKSPCDLSAIMPYLGKSNNTKITCEFNYVNQNGVTITAFNNTTHIIESQTLDKKQINEVLADAPFLDEGAFQTATFKKKWDFIFMSILPDEHEGVYLHKKTGIKICFSSANFDLTEEKNWEKFINGEYANHGFKFTETILRHFKNSFEFQGFIHPDDIINNLKQIREHLPKETTLVLMLGSEIDFHKNTAEFAHHAANNMVVNKKITEAFTSISNVILINYTNYITSQECYADCINHFSRKVYYEIAQKVTQLINSKQETDAQLKMKSKIAICIQTLKQQVSKLKHNIIHK